MLVISKIISTEPPVLKLKGTIDKVSFNSKKIQTEIENLLETGKKNLILDLEDVHFLHSEGLRFLVNEMKKINSSGGQMFIISPPSHITAMLEVCGLNSVFNIFGSYQEVIDFLKVRVEE